MRHEITCLIALIPGLVNAGCASLKPAQPVEPVIAHGFQFHINSMVNTASITVGRSTVERTLTLNMRCLDAERNRVVAFARGVALDEVRDDRGRDLLPYLDPGPISAPDPRSIAGTFDAFTRRTQVESRNGAGTNTLGRSFEGLPDNPKQLEIVRGSFRVVEATKLSTIDVPIKRSEDWLKLSPGLALQIDAAVRSDRNMEIRCLMQTARSGDELDALQEQRWYWIEVIGADGRIMQSQSGVPNSIKGGDARWQTAISLRDGDESPTTLRIMVIDEMVIHQIPFAYHNIAVQ